MLNPDFGCPDSGHSAKAGLNHYGICMQDRPLQQHSLAGRDLIFINLKIDDRRDRHRHRGGLAGAAAGAGGSEGVGSGVVRSHALAAGAGDRADERGYGAGVGVFSAPGQLRRFTLFDGGRLGAERGGGLRIDNCHRGGLAGRSTGAGGGEGIGGVGQGRNLKGAARIDRTDIRTDGHRSGIGSGPGEGRGAGIVDGGRLGGQGCGGYRITYRDLVHGRAAGTLGGQSVGGGLGRRYLPAAGSGDGADIRGDGYGVRMFRGPGEV